jgi:undecaprenyl-diphosphatase
MPLLEIIVLAIVQGLTEFLPVSSSGHLVVANALLAAFGAEPARDLIEVSVVLHLGTLAAVLVFYRREILRLLAADRRAVVPLTIATIPAAVIGIYIEKGLPEASKDFLLENPLVAGLMFLVTAAGLWWATRRPQGELHYTELPPASALIVGLLQAFAILPGISRSGATIVGGLGVGLRREAAAAFSFLMAIPVIGGAGLLKMKDAVDQGSTSTPLPTLALGFAISMVVGLAALWLLLRMLRRGRLELFVYYLVPLGLAVTAWQILK